MMDPNSRYLQRGVSADKSEVHRAIRGMDKGLYPLAFCKILADFVGGDDAYCNIMHADTAGTKPSLAYIYWRETGDMSVWKGIVQDALVMNLDDMACVGCVDNIVISSTIARNKQHIPGEVVSALIEGCNEFIEEMSQYGVSIHLAGGETADVGDIIRTLDVGYTAFARMKRSDLVVNDIQNGDVIVGLASYGRATYESAYNGGMGSNGLTSARHDVFSSVYGIQYPETFDPAVPRDLVYSGPYRVTDLVDIGNGESVSMGKLVLSPTRTFLPVLKSILQEYKSSVHGIIHCTGGGQTKVKKFIKNKSIIKDNLLPTPPLFKIIEEVSGTSRAEMYQVFNMGTRMEIYVPANVAGAIMDIAKSFGIDAQIIGRVEDSVNEEVIVKDSEGVYHY